jgi:hypothetical protein
MQIVISLQSNPIRVASGHRNTKVSVVREHACPRLDIVSLAKYLVYHLENSKPGLCSS